jgi:hypothetical protein
VARHHGCTGIGCVAGGASALTTWHDARTRPASRRPRMCREPRRRG